MDRTLNMSVMQVVLVCALLACYSTSATIVSRDDWGAREPRDSTDRSMPVSRVIIHHTATRSCYSLSACSSRVRSIQNDHMDSPHKQWDDIGYNFLVGEDGRVYEGRGWDKVGSHAKYHNRDTLGISFIGNFENRLPNNAAITAAQDLLSDGVDTGKLTSYYSVEGHSDVKDTECPGTELYDNLYLLEP